jgi:sodium-dependent dicarboxylate transporter 2/3/5
MSNNKLSVKSWIALGVVIALSVFLWAVPTSFFGIEGLTPVMQRTIAIFVFTALMWIIEVIPTWTTSVVSMVIMLLTISNKGLGFLQYEAAGKLVDYKSIMASFADPVIMLFLGGFVLAIAASKVGLDVAIAKTLLKPFKKPKWVLLAFLLIIGVFSMFMSNTATAAMMLTFLAPVLAALPKDERGKIGLALSIPIAANLGGMGTPIGTPPNAIALGALQEAGYNITFVGWMIRMVPFVIVMLLIAWFLLTKMFPFKAKTIDLKIEGAPVKVTPFQKYVVWVTFALTIILWVGESVFGVNSNIVAMIPFAVFSATGILKSRDLEHINWAVLWMVAGGFALGTALNQTGLATTLINTIPFASWNAFVVMLVGGFICYFLSNFISNSAAANLVVPILVVVGKAMTGNPSFEALGGVPSMIAGIAICASIAMCLPVSTPPNALAASTGMISTKQMATVGIIMGVIGFVLGFAMLIFVGF